MKNNTPLKKKIFELAILLVKVLSAPSVSLFISLALWVVTKKDFGYDTIIVCSVVWFVFLPWIYREKKIAEAHEAAEGDMSFGRSYGFKASYCILFITSIFISLVLTVF
jgi:hypothetical protein